MNRATRILCLALILTGASWLPALGISVKVDPGEGKLQVREVGGMRFIKGNKLRVDSDEVLASDVYAFTAQTRIRGTIEGDLALFTSTIDLPGRVTGDINVFAQTVEIEGEVGDDVRAFMERFVLSGRIGGNALITGGRIDLKPSSVIDGSVMLSAGEVNMEGHVGGAVRLTGAAVTLAGSFAGDVRVECDELTVEPGLTIAGDLIYRSRNHVELPEGAVQGTVEQQEYVKEEDECNAFSLLDFPTWLKTTFRLYLALASVLGGLLFILFFRPFVEGSLRHTEGGANLIASFGIGLVTLLVSLVLSLLCLLLLPLGLGILSALGAVTFFGSILGKMVVGRLLLWPLMRRMPHPVLALLLGVVVCLVLDFIPILGELVWLFFTVTGVGASLHQLRCALPGHIAEAVEPVTG